MYFTILFNKRSDESIYGFVFSCLVLPFSSVAEDNYKFRVYLIDKPIAERQQPELSQKSMARRQKFNISLDETDYAVSAEYCRKIASLYPIVSKSRWMNTVVISAADVSCVDILKKFFFFKKGSMVWKSSSLRMLPKIVSKNGRNGGICV